VVVGRDADDRDDGFTYWRANQAAEAARPRRSRPRTMA
jgi:hypothetical protein